MSKRFTWTKAEKLKSRKRIERVFKEGKSFSLFPFRVYFLIQSLEAVNAAGQNSPIGGSALGQDAPVGETWDTPLQAGFGASSRNFKKAVDRNRIKRLSREAYRLQKHPLHERLTEKGLSMAVFFIYTGKELPVYATATEKIGVALKKLIKEIA